MSVAILRQPRGPLLPNGDYAPQAFWRRVRRTADCWEWLGSRSPERDYGSACKNPRQRLRAHRYAWELVNGPIQLGLFVLHTCDNRLCVRRDHLYLGTNDDNTEDMARRDRAPRHGNTLPKCVTRTTPGKRKPYQAIVSLHGKKQYIGTYNTIDEASAAVLAWEIANGRKIAVV